MFWTYITSCVKISIYTVYYAVKRFIRIGEHLEVPILCKKIDKKELLYIFFLPVIKLAKLCTFRFYTPQSSISTIKTIACHRAQPPCVWAGIIINKIFKNKDRTSNLHGCISVACHTAQLRCSMEVWSSHVCPVTGTLSDFMGKKLPSYENISKCLLLDKKKVMKGTRVQYIYSNALPL